jgi:ribosomal protein S18 acetylase RimI-like enzyme
MLAPGAVPSRPLTPLAGTLAGLGHPPLGSRHDGTHRRIARRIDWAQAKADLAADDFDNGRSPGALQASFERSQHVAIARDGDRVVGMARLLSDGVCNAYLLDVWTMSAYRRQGIGSAMVRQLMTRASGQHIGLQTDDAEAFYTSLGYRYQPVFMSAIVGEWLVNEANQA